MRSHLPPPPPSALSAAAPRSERLLAGFVALVGCLAFTVAARLDPYDSLGQPRSHGTHRQLGLPSCHILSTLGFPCPSCGMTTSISLLAHGDLPAAWQTNWAGVCVGTAGFVATGWLALLAAGMRRQPAFSAERSILLLTLSGAAAALLRYVTLVGQVVQAIFC